APAEHRELEVRKSSLVAALACVADHDGEHIDAEMVAVRPRERRADEVAPVAAAHVEHDGRLAAEQLAPVQVSLRHRLERGLRPLRWIEDLPGERHPELALDPVGVGIRLWG